MFTSKCGKCERVFDRSSTGERFQSQLHADQAARMHDYRKHRNMKPKHQRGGRSKHVLAGTSNGLNHGYKSHKHHQHQRGSSPRRVLASVLVGTAPGRELKQSAYEQMCHCPRCGLNLKALVAGMAMALAEGV